MNSLHTIPPEVLDRHVAVLAMNGAGKTYGVKGTIVEPLLAAGKRVAVLDPTGVYYGLRLSPDGKKSSGLDIVIFGGPHADFPISDAHGEAVAEVIATSSRSAIVDTADLTVGARTRFFAGFAETLLRKNRGPLHLVIDEAHLFAPQGRVADPQSGRMLHAANNLVSLGRSRGLRVTLISQRPAKLHKDSLTQAHSLVVMRLIAPQDRDAARAWIEGQPDAKRGEEVLSSLSGLAVGHGWLWAPEISVLSRIAFPKIKTFDSSRAPDEADDAAVALPALDVADIRAKLDTVAAEVVANDPAQLKKRIADLETALAQAQEGAPDPDEANKDRQDAFRAGYQQGQREGDQAGFDRAFAMGVEAIGALWREVLDVLTPMRTAVEQLQYWNENHFDTVEGRTGRGPSLFDVAPETWQRLDAGPPPLGSGSPPVVSPRPAPSPKHPTPGRAASVPSGNGRDKVLSPAQLRVLDALAWLESISVKEASREMAAFLADASPRSSSYANNLGALRTSGYLEYASAGALALTARGRATAQRPAKPLNHGAMMAHVCARLEPAQARILAAVAEAYPQPVAREHVARKANASHTSSSFANNLGKLRGLGLITYQPQKRLRAADRLYP